MKNPWVFPVVTLILGVVGGYISGKNTNPGDGKATVAESSRKTRSSNRGVSSSQSEKSGRSGNRAGGTDAISRMPGSSNRVQAMMDFYASLTPQQLAEEAGKLEGLPLSERMIASFLLFGRWAETDPTAAIAFSNTMGFTGSFVRPTILQSWASVDPSGAAKYLGSNPREFAMMGMMGGGRGPMGGQSPSSIIATEWARQDPAAALAWANSLTTDKEEALNAVVSETAKMDPKKAIQMLASMTGTNKSDAYKSIASQYGASNFTEAQTWIRTLPADAQADALASAISGLSNKDPNEAARQVAQMEAGEAKDRALEKTVSSLVRLDPKAAADLLKQQGSESSLRDGMRELMPTWVNQNAAAALSYANSFEAGTTRDSALQSYVWSNNTSAPADLVKVAETIADRGDRDRTLGVAASRWMREDPTAAKAYVEQSTSLSADAKQRITEGRGMWGGGGRGRGGN